MKGREMGGDFMGENKEPKDKPVSAEASEVEKPEGSVPSGEGARNNISKRDLNDLERILKKEAEDLDTKIIATAEEVRSKDAAGAVPEEIARAQENDRRMLRRLSGAKHAHEAVRDFMDGNALLGEQVQTLENVKEKYIQHYKELVAESSKATRKKDQQRINGLLRAADKRTETLQSMLDQARERRAAEQAAKGTEVANVAATHEASQEGARNEAETQTPAPEVGQVSIRFVKPRQMRRELLNLGYGMTEITDMPHDEAIRVIQNGVRRVETEKAEGNTVASGTAAESTSEPSLEDRKNKLREAFKKMSAKETPVEEEAKPMVRDWQKKELIEDAEAKDKLYAELLPMQSKMGLFPNSTLETNKDIVGAGWEEIQDQYLAVLDNYSFIPPNAKELFWGGDSRIGHKLHLNVPKDSVIAVSEYLKAMGFMHKYLSGGEAADGKVFTVYCGAKDVAKDAADKISRDLAQYLRRPAERTEVEYAPNVVGRFDGVGEFMQYSYGIRGLPVLRKDIDLLGINYKDSTDEEKKKIDILQFNNAFKRAAEKYGVYFYGSGKSAGAGEGPLAGDAAQASADVKLGAQETGAVNATASETGVKPLQETAAPQAEKTPAPTQEVKAARSAEEASTEIASELERWESEGGRATPEHTETIMDAVAEAGEESPEAKKAAEAAKKEAEALAKDPEKFRTWLKTKGEKMRKKWKEKRAEWKKEGFGAKFRKGKFWGAIKGMFTLAFAAIFFATFKALEKGSEFLHKKIR